MKTEPAPTAPATIRQSLEENERNTLAPGACLSAESQGRERAEDEHPYRTAFQRDRDRILHTKAFRRLKGKTQVFLAPKGDHYRTRMTHTLEVTQIARTAARALFLNEDLCEAIAMGHDLGHTPFGHTGEAVLNRTFSDGFKHYEQSLRVVDRLELTRRGRGLNLTFEVRDGIVRHSTGKAILLGRKGLTASTLEGQVVSVADAIAYVSHDIDDAVRAGVITLDDLPKEALDTLGRTASERIDRMVTGLIEGSRDDAIAMADPSREALVELRAYLYTQVYPSDAIESEVLKAERIVEELYAFLLEHPERLETTQDGDSPERRAVDFLAGMTDRYAMDLYREQFFPSAGDA